MGDEKKHKAPKEIRELLERFERNLHDYKSKGYNEFQLRIDFINPLFKALGWDIGNKKGAAPAYRDVIFEDSIKIGGGTKAPDYCFTLSGSRKFFVETKKPSINIKRDPKPAYQLRRYAWSSKLILSILTNFEELVIYEARQRPRVSDKPEVERIKTIHYKDYIEKWDEIYSIFSYTAVIQGSFDKYAEAAKKKRGTKEVDEEFLDEIEEWREKLAKNIAIRNPDLSVRELNYCVQRTIDRIIFLRMCEDKGTEKYGQLQSIAEKENIYSNLCIIFKKADEKYNSGLFHFKKEKNRNTLPDEITLELIIDDNVLKNIFRRLYFPNSPYEFSVISPEILGNVYEQFLGKIIRLTEGHRAKIEEKPEVKKAGGVYYTPEFIVEYIIEKTVGKLIKGKTPKQISNLKILDPACGSGSFLLGAYSKLLHYHLGYYSARRNPKTYKDQIYQGKTGDWNLTIKEKKRILLNNIYGVDIDSQAVEVTKLSLLLKVLEGESRDVFQKQQKLWQERALPDLGNNIKCGNSLIGPDFFTGGIQTNLFDKDEIYRINPFDWNKEFKEIMDTGGYDVIIGNPPYINAWILYEDNPEIRNYINSSNIFETAERHWDIYILFLELSLKLAKEGGRIAFIIPFSYAIQKYARASRNKLLKNSTVDCIADLRTVRVFGKVPVITMIPVFQNSEPHKKNTITIHKPGPNSTKYIARSIISSHKVLQSRFLEAHEEMLRLDLSDMAFKLCKKIMSQSIIFGDLSLVNYGAQMSSREKGKFGKEFVLRDKKDSETCRPTVSGRNLYRYSVNWTGKYVEWALANEMYGPRHPSFFELPKIMIRDITGTHRLELTIDKSGLYCDHTILCAQRSCDATSWKDFKQQHIELSRKYSLELLLGLLASRTISAYYYLTLTGEGIRIGGGFHTYPKTIRQLPIYNIELADKNQKRQLEKIETLSKHMLELNKRIGEVKTNTDKILIQRQINATDEKIDNLVFKLYGFTEKEISIVRDLAS